MADNNATSPKPSGTYKPSDPMPQHHRLAEDQKVDTGCGKGKSPGA